MKITHIKVENFLGMRAFSEDLPAPITLIAGDNGAGKSSLLQAIRFALTDSMPRVDLKKDGALLVSDGAKTGSITISAGEVLSEVSLPACKIVRFPPIHQAMPYLCDMRLFASVPSATRKEVMAELTGVRATPDAIRTRLAAKSANAEKVDVVLPFLNQGFHAAHKEASARATEAKGAWRAITGETYGAKKAEGWSVTAPSANQPVDLPGLNAELVRMNADLEAENKALGAAEQRRSDQARDAAKLSSLRDTASKLDRITTKLEIDRNDRDSWKSKVEDARRHLAAPKSLTCPDCGAVLVIDSGGQLVPLVREMGDDTGAEYSANLPEHEKALKLLESAVTNGERDLASAQAAAEQLKSANAQNNDAESDEQIAQRKSRIADIKNGIRSQSEIIQAAIQAMRASTEAKSKTEKAAQHHRDVAEWALIADALAPDGIPGELLAQALKQINEPLAQAAADSGWPPVTVDAEMTIRYGGRPYALISESEQWRADAMLTIALAGLSGMRMALLDRLDVLDLTGRSEAIGWLGVLAEHDEVDTVVVAATLKSLPTLPPTEFQAFWIDAGAVSRRNE